MNKYLVVVLVAVSAQLQALAQPAYPTAPAPVPVIDAAEYFFDKDPGFGNGTAIAISPATDLSNLTRTLALNGTALTPGFHYFYLRTRDANGLWSHTTVSFFDNMPIFPYPSSPGNIPNLVAAEYFIDNDPGPGNGRPIALPNSTDAPGVNVLVDVTGITPGAHQLFVRTKDADGRWSLANFAVFDNATLVPYPSAPAPAPALGGAEYFLDTDPGFGNGLPITLPAQQDVTDFQFSIPLSGISAGLHTVYIRSKQNPWSMVAYADFVVGSTLPVQWNYVKAEKRNADALITWATGSELNAASFIIEGSNDGQHYTSLGEVAAANSTGGHSYQFTHKNPGGGTWYYRIRQVDIDGAFTFSKIMMLLFADHLDQALLFPNPAGSSINVAIPTGSNPSLVSIYDLGGKLVMTKPVNNTGNVLSISLQGLRSGQYLLKLKQKDGVVTLPFIKQ